mgnify:FL=1|jgi:hypothetical protein
MAKNINFLSPLNYKLVVGKIPNIEYFCTSVSVPAISIEGDNPTYSTPQREIRVYSHKLNFSPLSITTIIDENLENYKEIYDWIQDIVFSDDSKPLEKSSDITLLIMNSKNNTIKKMRFTNAFPVAIGPLDFTSINESVEYVTSTVEFEFTDMILE